MTVEKPLERMTLREMLAAAEKCSRDLHEMCGKRFLPQAAEFREMSRPIRRRSHYPTLNNLQNSLKKLQGASDDLQKLARTLIGYFQHIKDQARVGR